MREEAAPFENKKKNEDRKRKELFSYCTTDSSSRPYEAGLNVISSSMRPFETFSSDVKECIFSLRAECGLSPRCALQTSCDLSEDSGAVVIQYSVVSRNLNTFPRKNAEHFLKDIHSRSSALPAAAGANEPNEEDKEGNSNEF